MRAGASTEIKMPLWEQLVYQNGFTFGRMVEFKNSMSSSIRAWFHKANLSCTGKAVGALEAL